MKKYYAYKIYSQPFNPDLLSGILWENEITGLTEEEDHIKIFTDVNIKDLEESLRANLERLQAESIIQSFKIEKEILEDRNWNEEWEKSREVIRASERIVIKPSFKSYKAKEGEIVLTIDPKMSFGTGEHATTKLMLRLLEKFIKPGMKILDVGSGTGILSIAALKLGASSATAIDNDPVCYENCIENCITNCVEKSVAVFTGEIEEVKEKDFDLVTANIQSNVLKDISNEIRKRLGKNGISVLSGILLQEEDKLTGYYTQAGFKLIIRQVLDEWTALVFKTAG